MRISYTFSSVISTSGISALHPGFRRCVSLLLSSGYTDTKKSLSISHPSSSSMTAWPVSSSSVIYHDTCFSLRGIYLLVRFLILDESFFVLFYCWFLLIVELIKGGFVFIIPHFCFLSFIAVPFLSFLGCKSWNASIWPGCNLFVLASTAGLLLYYLVDNWDEALCEALL